MSTPIALDTAGALAAVLRHVAEMPLLVGLDFDGTLAPIADRPEGARLDLAMRNRLARLATLVPTAVVSGRDLDDLYQRVPVPGLTLAGSHGVEIAHPDGTVERAPGLDRSDADLPALIERLRRTTAPLSGVLVEPKRHSVAVHWRLADPIDQLRADRLVDAAAAAFPAFRIVTGKMVAELRPATDHDKGTALSLLRAGAIVNGGVPAVLYIGDDVTDEDAFRILDPARDIGVLVTGKMRPTAARWHLPDTEAVGAFLDRVIAARNGADPATP